MRSFSGARMFLCLPLSPSQFQALSLPILHVYTRQPASHLRPGAAAQTEKPDNTDTSAPPQVARTRDSRDSFQPTAKRRRPYLCSSRERVVRMHTRIYTTIYIQDTIIHVYRRERDRYSASERERAPPYYYSTHIASRLVHTVRGGRASAASARATTTHKHGVGRRH